MRRLLTFSLLATAALLSCFTPLACAQKTSENDVLLRGVLELFPSSDRDGDGVLSQVEGLAHTLKMNNDVGEQLDVVYGLGDGQDLTLDLYVPKAGEQTFPLVVFIHGGGWQSGSKNDLRNAAKICANLGYVTATVQYRLSPASKFPAQVEDVKCAVRWLRANAEKNRIDPHRVAALGLSAGGHLSLMLGLMDEKDGLHGEGGSPDQSSKVQAVVNCFGPTDLTTDDWLPAVDKMLVNLTGGTLAEKRKVYQQASPLTYLDKNDPPIITFHGTADKVVPFSQAERLDKRAKQLGVSHTLVAIEDAGHGWGGDDLINTLVQAKEFLATHLQKKTD